MHPSSIIQLPNSEIYSINCVEQVTLGEGYHRVRFRVRCRFQIMGQSLFLGMLDTDVPWHEESRRGFGVSLDTEDGTVTDMINGQGVIEYVDSAPLPTDRDVELGIDFEKQGRVAMVTFRVGAESFLHPAFYMENTRNLGVFVGTTLLWGASAFFHDAEVDFIDRQGTVIPS